MELQSLLIILMAVVMAIVASWSLSIFIRLHNVSIKYDSDRALEDSCNFTHNYVKVGRTVAIVLIALSILILLFSSVWFVKSL